MKCLNCSVAVIQHKSTYTGVFNVGMKPGAIEKDFLALANSNQ